MTPTLYLATALLVIVVLRRFLPIAAAILGILVSIGVGAWGLQTHAQGGGMAFLGKKVPLTAFFVFVILLFVFELLNLYVAITRRRRLSARHEQDPEP